MEDYRPNSNLSKRKEMQPPAIEKKDDHEVKKVELSGQVKVKKQSKFKKFKNEMIAEDAKNVKSYILQDVLFPSLKNLVYDTVVNAISMALGVGNRAGSSSFRRPVNGYSSRVSYGNYFRASEEPRRPVARAAGGFDLDEIIFDNRGDAEVVLDQMYETLKEYKIVRVFDLYEFVGMTAPYTADRYGWTDLYGTEVVRINGGEYVIRFPRIMAID